MVWLKYLQLTSTHILIVDTVSIINSDPQYNIYMWNSYFLGKINGIDFYQYKGDNNPPIFANIYHIMPLPL